MTILRLPERARSKSVKVNGRLVSTSRVMVTSWFAEAGHGILSVNLDCCSKLCHGDVGEEFMATALATVGGGCFWCLEAVFERLRGVSAVTSGYAGGEDPKPTYEKVCGGRTGHAEVIQIEFDPEVVSFAHCWRCFSSATIRQHSTAKVLMWAPSTGRWFFGTIRSKNLSRGRLSRP